MKKMIATLAIAGLGATLAAGAQAQTVTGTGGGGAYAVTFTPTATLLTSGAFAGDYNYVYTVASTPVNTTGGLITSVVFSGILGYDTNASATSFGGGTPAVTAGSPTTITYSNGSVVNGTTFSFYDFLPPTATIGVVASGNAGGGTVNTGVLTLGPGTPAIPEAGSFALLGLGLLPLAFVARRRISR